MGLAYRQHARRSRGWPGCLALLAVALACGCRPPASERNASPAPAARESAEAVGGWRTFEGTWSAAGDRRTLEVAPGRQAAILDLSGSILLRTGRDLGVGFQAHALTYSDGVGNSVGRAVWTDERGDRIFSELRGAPIATGGSIAGTITGGTGRWNGITGEYAFDWTYVIEAEGHVQGRTEGLRGKARIAAPEDRLR